MARALARDLGKENYCITSGLARGIDTAAHEAALETGTIGVLAGGVDVIYPSENRALAAKIAETGLLLSEAPMGLAPQARHFPKRNRIIAGLSEAVVIVEAAAKSGSLITARDALDMGREVLAVPGHPFDARASGCNVLIRDGAQLVRHGADVIAALPARTSRTDVSAPSTRAKAPASSPQVKSNAQQVIPPGPPETRSLAETAALHSEILMRLGPSPTPEDQLLRDLALAPSELSPALTELELSGSVLRTAGRDVVTRPRK